MAQGDLDVDRPDEIHIWDASTGASLVAITTKYERKGKNLEIVGLDEASAERHRGLTGRPSGHWTDPTFGQRFGQAGW